MRILGLTEVVAVSILIGSQAISSGKELPELNNVFAKQFLIGAAISTEWLLQPEQEALQLVANQCNAITPENLLKWESVHPGEKDYNFDDVDRFVEFGEANEMFIVGHALIWHNQVPDSVFHDDAGNLVARDVLIKKMRDHIHSVVGRYKGRIHAWDVVNEALEDDGSHRDTYWRKVIGDEYLTMAFQFAHEADPNAELYYNDYSMFKPEKVQATAKLVRDLVRAGCRIDGIGLQAHWGIEDPSLEEVDGALRDLSGLGVKLMITELDIDVLPWPEGKEKSADVNIRGKLLEELNPYVAGLPDEMQQKLGKRYSQLFQLFLKYKDTIDRVTFWGIDDGHSWHNSWPIPGRTAHSLLFDRSYRPKPAFWSVIKTAE